MALESESRSETMNQRRIDAIDASQQSLAKICKQLARDVWESFNSQRTGAKRARRFATNDHTVVESASLA